MFWNRMIRWCREILFKINPVSGILLTANIDELKPIGKIHAMKSNVGVIWPSQYPKTLRSLSSNIVLVYPPEVEEYLESVGAVKMVNTDIGFYINGAYTDDITLLKARLTFLNQEPLVQGLVFAQTYQVVDFKLRFM